MPDYCRSQTVSDPSSRHPFYLQLLAIGFAIAVSQSSLSKPLSMGSLRAAPSDIHTDLATAPQQRSIVFVDSDLPAATSLCQSESNAQWVFLSKASNPIEQMTEHLRKVSSLRSIHIISHGNAGELQLGGQIYQLDDLKRHGASLRGWAEHLTTDADILLYGCDVASSSHGQSLATWLSAVTRADVAASKNKTGHASQGGDWKLEFQTGPIETAIAVSKSAINRYQYVLPITILAAGTTGEEELQLQIDGATVETFQGIGGDPNQRNFQTLTFDGAPDVTADRVRVAFTNDLFDPPNIDRNVIIDAIIVNGVRLETEDPRVFGTGTYLDVDGVTPGFRESETIHSNGFFEFFDPNNSQGSVIEVVVAGEVGDEEFELLIDGQVVEAFGPAGDGAPTRTFRTFTFFSPQDVTANQVRVAFTNDQFINGQDRNLLVDGIIIDGVGFESEDPSTLSTGTIFNGTEFVAGNPQSEFLFGNGFFEYSQNPTTDPPEDPVDLTVFDFDSFDGQDIVLNGSANLFQSRIEITPASNRQAGTAYYSNAIPLDSNTSFRTQFAFEAVGGSGLAGADGVALLFHNAPAGTGALGRNGSGFGYEFISNSVAVEFDTFQNPFDQFNDEVAITLNGLVRGQIEARPAPFDLNAGRVNYAFVDYNGESNVLAVYLSETPERPEVATLRTQLAFDEIIGDQFFIGFASSTFDRPNAHRVLSWDLSLETPPADPPVQLLGEIRSTIDVTGLNQPTSLAFSPDSRNMYIGEQGGVVKVVRDGGQTVTVIDISAEVNAAADRGLLDIAVHPDLANNPFLYLLYTYDPPEVFQNGGLAGPDQRGNRAGRLVRYTLDASSNFTQIVGNSETILLGTNSTFNNFNAFTNSVTDRSEPPAGQNSDGTFIRDFINSDSTTHSIGSLAFGNDGALFVSVGDGASFSFADPRAVRVQNIDSLSGKILRIDPITGRGLESNPFFNGDADANRSKVYQLGLRNPFRITVDRVTGRVYNGDVGWNTYEELNVGQPGSNFGWPFFEGGTGQSIRAGGGYASLPEAVAFYASGLPVVASQFAQNHSTGVNAIMLGDVIRNGNLGDRYEGGILFNDLGSGVVRHAVLDENGNLVDVEVFDTNKQFVVAIRQAPDGTVYFVDLADGQIGRWFQF